MVPRRAPGGRRCRRPGRPARGWPCTSALAATAAWRVMAPIQTVPSRRRCPSARQCCPGRPAASGAARRSFIEGSRLWPPASSLPPSAATAASATEAGFKGECVHGVGLLLSLGRWMAFHTRVGRGGHRHVLHAQGAEHRSTALITAGGEPMAPASPQPLVPSGLWVQGVQTWPSLNWGSRRRAAWRSPCSCRSAAGRFRVVHAVFQQRLANALHQAAVHLAFDDHRVDDGAEVVHRGERSTRVTPVAGSTSTSQM
jgi:hypothetical protein